MWFNINFERFNIKLLPTFLRGQNIVALCTVITLPLQQAHSHWLLNRSDRIYRLVHNAQCCYFQKALNDSFDFIERRIRIKDTTAEPQSTFIYTRSESQPVYLGKLYLSQNFQYPTNEIDFIVEAPAALQNYEERIKLLVDFYKLDGHQYTIQYV